MIEESLEEVYELAANYKNMKISELQNILANNYNLVFGSRKI
jgi:TatD DNase family protein